MEAYTCHQLSYRYNEEIAVQNLLSVFLKELQIRNSNIFLEATLSVVRVALQKIYALFNNSYL